MEPRRVRLAAFMFADDFDGLVEGGNSLLNRKDLQEIAQVDVVTDASAYQNDYDANEIAADNKYQGKKILLSGKVDSINKNAFDQGYLTLRTGSLAGMQAQLSSQAMRQAAALSRGTKVMIVCDAGPRVVDVPTATNCRFLTEYLRSINALPEKQMRDFFNGTRPFTQSEVFVMAFGYWIGTSNVPPTKCKSNPSRETCSVKSWQWDKAKGSNVQVMMQPIVQHILQSSRPVPCHTDTSQKCRQLASS